MNASRVVVSLLFVLAFATGCSDDGTCIAGSIDCECLAGSDCSSLDLVCIDDVCRACDAGTQGCGCFDDGGCVTELMGCAAGRCGWSEAPPTDPKCYSPCSSDLVRADGSVVRCSAEGLMEGCIGDNECIGGTCAPPGTLPEDLTACWHDSDCADFQACISGGCFSTCDVDSDCGEGRSCYRHTCRFPCNTTDAVCAGSDRICKTYDGNNGYCMPALPPTGPGVVHDRGGFTVLPKTIEFSNVGTRDDITLVNNSTTPQDFTLHKKSHSEYTSEGAVVVSDVDGQPLFWLAFQGCTLDNQTGDCTVRLDPGDEHVLTVSGAANPTIPRWDGVVTLNNENFGEQEVRLTYVERPDGQWVGKMYYFADFEDVGLQEWTDCKTSGVGDCSQPLANVKNAFVQKWTQFTEDGPGITFDEFVAVISSTQNASWKWPTINDYAGCTDPKVACYPYATNAPDDPGFRIYTSDEPSNPIPTGMVEFPIAMNLQQFNRAATPELLRGKVVSEKSLHFPGDPQITIDFEGDPSQCQANSSGTVVCPMVDMAAEVHVGGRYQYDQVNCGTYVDGTYGLFKTPWLVPGFIEGTNFEDGDLYYKECRDSTLPFGNTVDLAINQGLAASNPIPDGATRQRKLQLVAGALVNSKDMLIIFKEHFESFMGVRDTKGFSAYGLMRLSRASADLEPDAFAGNVVDESRTFDNKLGVACSDEFLQEISSGLNEPEYDPDSAFDIPDLVDTILSGGPTPALAVPIAETATQQVHFICMDTGLIDNDDPEVATDVPCPEGSEVRYFVLTATGGETVADFIARQTCGDSFSVGPDNISYDLNVADGYVNGTDTFHATVSVDVGNPGSCWNTLSDWMQTLPSGFDLVMDPPWRCADGSLTCSTDRFDLKDNKLFYDQPDGATPPVAFVSAQAALNDAFRYKTRFRSRSGSGIGFTPTICVPNSNSVPYCYDPLAIEQLRHRVSCAAYVYTEHYDLLAGPSQQAELERFLKRSLAYEEQKFDAGNNLLEVPIIHEGFDRLYAELLIMLGDDAYTAAAASRFDLAGMNVRSFEGTLFEPPDGINLSGGAGYEMVKLYQSTQYYQLVLDRFYSMTPIIWKSLDPISTYPSFVTTETVTAYIDRVIRASTQKSRAWSEIAERYLNYNQPNLARRVVGRAYVSAYLESIVLSRMMLQLLDTVEQADKAEIKKRVELAQLGYRSALLDMQQMYDTITDEVTVFGFPPYYIPFPALDPDDTNAFDKIFESAMDLADVAAEKEAFALDSNRNYNVDSAAFQSEMVSIRNNYEDQLAELCGTFRAENGTIYPATIKYAELQPKLRLTSDPCGLLNTGSIHDALVEVELSALDLRSARQAIDDQIELIHIEEDTVTRHCNLINETAQYIFEQSLIINGIQLGINVATGVKEMIERVLDHAKNIAELTKCEGDDVTGLNCATAGLGVGSLLALYGVADVTIGIIDVGIVAGEMSIAEMERSLSRWEMQRECEYARVISDGEVRKLVLGLRSLTLQAQRGLKSFLLAQSQVEALVNEAQRLQDQQSETEQLAINVEAARNDPNVRIYKNDSILTADRTFYRALREAYRATKVYEYYTSQSYAPLIDLFLVRMVSHGDITLESYLDELASNFSDFEEAYGNPDLRVEVLSLRDDIFAIPYYDENTVAMSDAERVTAMRNKLSDVTLLDENGYININFATTLGQLSPLTLNHKINYIEAQILGSDIGDAVARVYVRQRGTGTVRGTDGDKRFYIFPERTAVVNAIVGEERVFNETIAASAGAKSVYINERLRDRPMANTHWELVLNQRDEAVNQDVNLGSIDDIFLHVYYTDFTQL